MTRDEHHHEAATLADHYTDRVNNAVEDDCPERVSDLVDEYRHEAAHTVLRRVRPLPRHRRRPRSVASSV